MKNEEWDGIEFLLERINSEIEDLNSALVEIKQCRLGLKAKDCVAHLCLVVENLEQYSDSLYGKCEASYADDDDDDDADKLKGYEEVLELLPNGSKLSVGEVLAIIDHIKTWRKEYGYQNI